MGFMTLVIYRTYMAYGCSHGCATFMFMKSMIAYVCISVVGGVCYVQYVFLTIMCMLLIFLFIHWYTVDIKWQIDYTYHKLQTKSTTYSFLINSFLFIYGYLLLVLLLLLHYYYYYNYYYIIIYYYYFLGYLCVHVYLIFLI